MLASSKERERDKVFFFEKKVKRALEDSFVGALFRRPFFLSFFNLDLLLCFRRAFLLSPARKKEKNTSERHPLSRELCH